MAETYSTDPFNIISSSLEKALIQVEKNLKEDGIDLLVDVALGAGESFVRSDKTLNVKKYIGNDLSAKMLELAKKNFPRFTPICDNAVNINNHLSEQSVDLLYVHFVFAYLYYESFIPQIKELLKPGGYLSIVTTNTNNLAEIHQVLFRKISYFYRDIYDLMDTMPSSTENLAKQAEEWGLEVVEVESMKMPIEFLNFEDFWVYGYKGGWHIQSLDLFGSEFLDKLWTRSLAWLIQLFVKELRYPLRGSTNISIMLLRKPL